MLVRTHMQDLKDVTRETHYENYRAQCIQSMTRLVVKERNRKYGQRPGRSGRGGVPSAAAEETQPLLCSAGSVQAGAGVPLALPTSFPPSL